MGGQIESRANPIKLLGKSSFVRSCVQDMFVHWSFGKLRDRGRPCRRREY